MAWLLLIGAGCSCQPDLDPPVDTRTDGTGGISADSGSEPSVPSCAWPEVEPNDAVGEEVVLPLELEGCGTLDPVGDRDRWTVGVEEDGWLSVRTAAAAVGSSANLSLGVIASTGGAAFRDDGVGLNGEATPDPSLTFPTAPGSLSLDLTEQDDLGGPDHTYTVRASRVKAPVDWTGDELEPNDGSAAAQPILDGQGLFATLSGLESDWFVFDAAGLEGKVDLELTVDAWKFGSPADLVVTLYDADLAVLAIVDEGVDFADRDPVVSVSLTGGDRVYAAITERAGLGGPMYWYVVRAEAG